MKAIVTFLLFAPVLAFCQAATNNSPTPSPSPSRIPMWRADLPGGTYEVAIRSIISISTHEYVVDGVARVTELNIETPGSVEVRFYYLEPIVSSSPIGIGQSTMDRIQELATEANGRVNPGDEPPWEKVVKSYPTTTHAHTVEYRLDSKADVQSLFNSVDQAFRTNVNTEIGVQ
jgi:hypothetical protein